MKKPIKYPEFLQPDDLIAVLSPAGAAPEKDCEETISLLKKRGYRVKVMPHAYDSYSDGYTYSGTEKNRLKDLQQALKNEEVKAIWTTRGGYGCMHLLDKIDWGKRKDIPWIIGYSDVTALQAALLREKNVASLHAQSLRKASFGIHPDAYEAVFCALEGEFPNFEFTGNAHNRSGKARGQLIGGNLSLIYALLASDKFGFKFKDRILFIEEIGEALYSLDRMLTALELAGVFEKIGGLIIGGMSQMGEEKSKDYAESFSEEAYACISKKVAKYDFPVAYAFPNGHIYDNFPLVIGAETELSVQKKHASLLYV